MASPHEGEWVALRSRLPSDLDLTALGRETRAFLRPRGVRDVESLLRLALARGPGGLSIDGTAAWAAAQGIAQLAGPSLHQRLHQSVGFLQAIVAHLLGGRAATGSPLWRGRQLRVADSTTVSQPGSTGTDWRVHAVYDLAQGRFAHLDLTDGRGGEGLCRGAVVTRSVQVRFMPARGQPPRPLRIVALRLPDAQAEANRKRVLQRASRRQHQTGPRSLVAAGYVLLGTTLPDDILTTEILAAYRLRWQIELTFKRLKSLLHIDRLPTKTEKGGQSWLYAHLILALLCEDMTQEFLESFPSGPC